MLEVRQLSVNYRGVKVDRILLLNQRLITDGSPQQLMTPDHLQQAYGTLLNLHSHQDLNPDLFCEILNIYYWWLVKC